MENRGLLTLKKSLRNWNLPMTLVSVILKDPDEFAKVELVNNTLSWSNVEQFITDKNNKKVKVPFEIGADFLLKFSNSEVSGL